MSKGRCCASALIRRVVSTRSKVDRSSLQFPRIRLRDRCDLRTRQTEARRKKRIRIVSLIMLQIRREGKRGSSEILRKGGVTRILSNKGKKISTGVPSNHLVLSSLVIQGGGGWEDWIRCAKAVENLRKFETNKGKSIFRTEYSGGRKVFLRVVAARLNLFRTLKSGGTWISTSSVRISRRNIFLCEARRVLKYDQGSPDALRMSSQKRSSLSTDAGSMNFKLQPIFLLDDDTSNSSGSVRVVDARV